MNDFELSLTFWHWWVLGVALLILELFAPGAFFIWVGIAALAMGTILVFATTLPWEYQILGFAILSVISAACGRIYLKRNPIKTDQPLLNRRSAQYIGRIFTIEEPIVNGRGKIKVDDSIWKIEGADCPVNSRVKVVAVDGVILQVEQAAENN